jgi:hypothetical protein
MDPKVRVEKLIENDINERMLLRQQMKVPAQPLLKPKDPEALFKNFTNLNHAFWSIESKYALYEDKMRVI